ncbi:MAG: deiodinase family protein [Planctomycetaceae bacterium]
MKRAYAGQRMPEAIAMYLVIARGGQMDGDSGWFGPAESRFSWEWLAKLNGIEPDQPLKKDNFKGDEKIFAQLDRDHDGSISAFDLDWSDDNPWVRQSYLINRMYRRIDPSGDGEMTEEDWEKFFRKVAGEKTSFRFEQFRDALIPPGNGFLPGDEPRKETLIQGLFSGEIGSMQEGPALEDVAPDFELRPLQGGEPVRLSERIGKKPVVLVFGNFTCGPFRSLYATVESVRERQKDNVEYLCLRSRKPHPTDGGR